MAKAFAVFESIEASGRIVGMKTLPTLDQRHLWRKVISLQDFDEIVLRSETDVISSPIVAAAQQPESSHPMLSSLNSVWRGRDAAVADNNGQGSIASITGQIRRKATIKD